MDRYTLSFSPHIRDNSTVTKIMLDVIIALLPAAAVGVYFFGMNAAINLLLCVATAVATEALIQFLCKKPITVMDLSAVVTGLLLGMNLPPDAPFYLPVVGSIFAIAICKQLFGGLGHNFINPAITARIFLLIAWPVAMTAWVSPQSVDAVASATPLALAKLGQATPSLTNMLLGNVAGCIGETSAIALLAGGLYLIARRVISYRIPLAFIATVAIFSFIFTGSMDKTAFQLLAGGLFIGAFFMATDYATSPVTPLAQLVYGVGCGIITCVIRFFGGYPEGVSFSIAFMNLLTPLLEKAFKPKLFGEGAK